MLETVLPPLAVPPMLRLELYSESTSKCRGSSVFCWNVKDALRWPLFNEGMRKSIPEFKDVEKSKVYMVDPFLNSSREMELEVVPE